VVSGAEIGPRRRAGRSVAEGRVRRSSAGRSDRPPCARWAIMGRRDRPAMRPSVDRYAQSVLPNALRTCWSMILLFGSWPGSGIPP
jgi:hypothetical protein